MTEQAVNDFLWNFILKFTFTGSFEQRAELPLILLKLSMCTKVFSFLIDVKTEK